MILINVLLITIYSLNKEAPLLDIIPGEWDIVVGSQTARKNVFSPYSAEFHINPLTSHLDGSVWINNNSSDTFLDLEDSEIAQLEIEFQTPLSGQIYNRKPKKSLMTKFDFKPSNFGLSLVTRGKINDDYSFQFTLSNGTFFQIFIMSSKSSKVLEFYALRMAKPKASSPYSKQIKIAAIVLVSLILIQIIIWSVFKCCKSSIENKLAQQQESTVIDLDRYSEYLKEQEKLKKE